MTNTLKVKKELKKKVRALEKKIKNMKIAESPKKKRKLGPGSGGGEKEGKKRDGKGYFCPSKFAIIKRDLKSIIKDKKDPYNILSIRFSLLERWVNETIVQNNDNILQFKICSQHAR
jgi:hypothetical protein